MKNKCSRHPEEAVDESGVAISTLIRWDEAGKLLTVRTVDNQRRIPLEEIFRLRGHEEIRVVRCVLFARVSSVRQEQDGNLARQTEQPKETANERGYSVVQVMTEQAMSWKNVRLEVLDPPTIQEPTEELIQDMFTIVIVFADRLYGHRAIGMRKRVETVRKRMYAGRGD